jgi:hypothetical protein
MCVGAESIEIGGEGVLDKGCRCWESIESKIIEGKIGEELGIREWDRE